MSGVLWGIVGGVLAKLLIEWWDTGGPPFRPTLSHHDMARFQRVMQSKDWPRWPAPPATNNDIEQDGA